MLSNLDFISLGVAFIQSLNPDQVDLILHHTFNVCDKWLEDLLDIVTASISESIHFQPGP